MEGECNGNNLDAEFAKGAKFRGGRTGNGNNERILRQAQDSRCFRNVRRGRKGNGSLFGHGFEDVIEAVVGVGDAFELGVLFAVVVVQLECFVVAGVFDDQLDRRAAAFGVLDGRVQQRGGEGAAVDGDDLEGGSVARLPGDAVHDDVADGAGGVNGEAE